MHTARDLLERGDELAHGIALLEGALAGHGRACVVKGQAGIGKTALLGRLVALGEEQGLRVLRARGSELERAFPHGIVRQLFESELRSIPSEARDRILSGAAELAAPIVAPDSPRRQREEAASDPFAVAHGLYWLVANLSETTPLLVAVDDAHWADAASLRFLAHLARRIEGLGVLLVVCVRTGDPGAADPALSQLTAEPLADVICPAPLSEQAVADLIAARLGEQPDAEFAAACHDATGGLPFLVGELVAALIADDVRPAAAAAALVTAVGPPRVAEAVLTRLAGASAPGASLARAVAVLGADARLQRAAVLATLDPGDAADAADALAAMDILRSTRPLEFVHPIVRGAIYESIPPAARAAAHAQAAELLADERADPDAVAAHLLKTDPAGRVATVDRLCAAAGDALQRGAPESAAIYLERALDEGGFDAQRRAELLYELGKALRRSITDPSVPADRLREAHALATDPLLRARTVLELGETLAIIQPAWDESADLVAASIAEIEGTDPELATRLEGLRAFGAFCDARLLPSLFERLAVLRGLAGAESPARRTVALQMANIAAWLGESREEILRLLDLGLVDRRLGTDEPPVSWVVQGAIQAFGLTDDLDRALALAESTHRRARALGSAVGVAMTSSTRGWIHGRRGALGSAEADARAVLAMLGEIDFETGVGGALFHMIDPLVERLEMGEEAAAVARTEFDFDPNSLFWPLGLEARGRVRLALGDTAGGVADLDAVEQTLYAHNNPNGWGWRPALALAVAGSDPDRAGELMQVYLDRAREIGIPRAIGIGLRTVGLLEGGAAGLVRLEESERVLRDSPARLELARTLVELGAARRRAGQRAAARDPLREGLDLAHRCGASRLEDRARQELAASGARPRRAMLTGRDALTATEQRIAQMAAEGMSNPEIAQALFVTRKTVENHLGRIFPKLGIGSREQLPDALGGRREPLTP